MKRQLHLDPIGGVAGDMLLGLMLDLGFELSELRALVTRLGLPDVELELKRVDRASIAAVKLNVIVRGQIEGPAESDHERLDHAHHADHDHHHHHHHEHHDDKHTDLHGRHRHELLAMVERAELPARAAARARRAIELLFEAEAQAHGVPADQLHLHEAGADDALIDILGTVLALDQLGIDRVSCSLPLPVGGGRVRCAHGSMPVPVPAVAELLKGLEVVGGPVECETITPTGAALLRSIVDRFGSLPAMQIERSGYGAGGRNHPQLPNVVRGVLGQTVGGALARRVAILETALDDMVGQDVPVLIDALLQAGARDAMVAPVTMKKGRSGLWLIAICDPPDARRLSELILRQSPSLGVRWREEGRWEWQRDTVEVQTPWGSVRIKRALTSDGRAIRGRAEWSDCQRLADQSGVAIERVRDAAHRSYHDHQHEQTEDSE
jgi:hypothetical protein